MAEDYLDLSELQSAGEDFSLESADYDSSGLTPVGNHINSSRTIKLRSVKEGIFYFDVIFDSGFQTEDGRSYRSGGRYPVKRFISTKKFSDDRNPGETSSVAQYLRACGFNPKGMTSSQLQEALLESQSIPIKVFVGRTDRAVKDPSTGEWTQRKLKTNDFNVGTKEEPVWVSEVTVEGVTYRATEKVGGFSRL